MICPKCQIETTDGAKFCANCGEKLPEPKKGILIDADCRIYSDKLAYSVKEAAIAIGLGQTSTYELVSTKQIEHVKVGTKILIPRDAIERYLRKNLIPVVDMSSDKTFKLVKTS